MRPRVEDDVHSACNTKGFFLLSFYLSTTADPPPAIEASLAMTKLQESLSDCSFQKFHCHIGVHAKFTNLDHQL